MPHVETEFHGARFLVCHCVIRHRMAKAVLLEIDGDEEWYPLSRVEVGEDSRGSWARIPMWLAEDRGLA